MPQVRMDGKCFQRIVKAGRICEYGNTAQKAVGHEERQQRQSCIPFAQPRVDQKDIHGNTAELKWKIPPDIAAASYGESESKLFPYLAAEHEYTAYKEKNIGFIRKIYGY